MRIAATFSDARTGRWGRVGLVPTMGFLHEGHLSLVDAARDECDTVVMSLFVNPLQFNESADLDRYPRDFNRDAELAAGRGVDVLFAPELSEMYPTDPLTRVELAGVTDELEGEYRPGHFSGVATVVAKLFAGVQPDRAYFGRKDAQQLAVVTRMAADLSLPVQVVPVPIVREGDGLALSSRNVFLDRVDRRTALGLSQGLMEAADAAEHGEARAERLEAIVAERLKGVEVDYVALAGAGSARRVESLTADSFLAVAAHVGATRLIDNIFLSVGADVVRADRGTRLEEPSILYDSRNS